jgi:hypothetical protein
MRRGAPETIRRRSWGLGRTLETFPEGERAMRRVRVLKRLSHVDPRQVARYISVRTRKWLRLSRMRDSVVAKLPVFVVGCNRSGTNMVCKAIGASAHGWDYPERQFSVAFNGYYLRPDRIIEWLIRLTPAPIVTFGSILDSQFTDDLLSRFGGSRAIWVYRRYEDVANSCARTQWSHQMKDIARWVARGELRRLGARGHRIGRDTQLLFAQLFREDLTDEESACLYWYMRNRLYFDLHLDTDPRVLIVQYEDAALNKEKAFRRIFRFLGFPFDPVILDGVFATSVGKHPAPAIEPSIREMCDDLKARLDAQYVHTT